MRPLDSEFETHRGLCAERRTRGQLLSCTSLYVYIYMYTYIPIYPYISQCRYIYIYVYVRPYQLGGEPRSGIEVKVHLLSIKAPTHSAALSATAKTPIYPFKGTVVCYSSFHVIFHYALYNPYKTPYDRQSAKAGLPTQSHTCE